MNFTSWLLGDLLFTCRQKDVSFIFCFCFCNSVISFCNFSFTFQMNDQKVLLKIWYLEWDYNNFFCWRVFSYLMGRGGGVGDNFKKVGLDKKGVEKNRGGICPSKKLWRTTISRFLGLFHEEIKLNVSTVWKYNVKITM